MNDERNIKIKFIFTSYAHILSLFTVGVSDDIDDIVRVELLGKRRYFSGIVA